MGWLTHMQCLGLDPKHWLHNVVVAVHGPVTAQGIQSLGLDVDVVSQDSSSFAGVLQALQLHWSECC